MSNKYYQKVSSAYQDIYDLCELQAYTAAPFSSSFTGETYAFQKAGSNTSNVTLNNYIIGDTACTAVKKGRMPTPTLLGSFTVPGSYTLTRSNSGITVTGPNSYSQTISASQFRSLTVPKEIIVRCVGGGGGGGGNGWWSPGKDKGGFVRICGGAGGGGGIAVGRVVLSNNTYNFAVGAGGGVGSDGSASDNSLGATGGTGGTSSFVSSALQAWYISASGGSGGGGGDGRGSSEDSISAGTGGSGGSASINVTYGGTRSGSAGNQLQNHQRSAISALTFTTTAGTGAPANSVFVTAKNNNGSPYNYDDLDGNGSYFSGGCSLGYGVYPVSGNEARAGVGGGGGGGSLKTDGMPGGVYLYY